MLSKPDPGTKSPSTTFRQAQYRLTSKNFKNEPLPELLIVTHFENPGCQLDFAFGRLRRKTEAQLSQMYAQLSAESGM